MKGIKFMLMYLAVAGLVFSSCGDDDTEDGDTLDAAAIVGKWKVTDVSTGVAAVDNQIKDIKESLMGDMFPNEYFEFAADKKYVHIEHNDEVVERGTYTVSGSEVSISYKDVENNEEVGTAKTKTMKLQVESATKLIWTDGLSNYSEFFGPYASLLGSNSFLKITLTKQQ